MRQIVLAVLFLFFFQLLTDFIEAVYSFGLLSTGLVLDVLTIVLLLSPVLLFVFRNAPPRWVVVALAQTMAICRVAEPLIGTRGKMYLAGIGAACFLLLLPSLLATRGSNRRTIDATEAATGLFIALISSIWLRSLGSGIDLSIWHWGQILGLIMAPAAFFGIYFLAGPSEITEEAALPHAGIVRVCGLCVGMIAVCVLLYFGFTTPNVITRWTEAPYPDVVALLMIGAIGFALLMLGMKPTSPLSRPTSIVVWNILFLAALVTTLYLHQVPLPVDNSAYPVFAPSPSSFARLTLTITLITFPVVLLDFLLFVRAINDARPTFRTLAAGFAAASIWLVLLIFFHICTTVYDYVPVVGPWFRDRFWFVYLLAGLGLLGPLLLVPKRHFLPSERPAWRMPFVAAFVFGISAVFATFSTAPHPSQQVPGKTCKVMTYNIQQGYSIHGQRNFDEQIAVIRKADPDILGIQETDTNRIVGGNNDLVRYFAHKLNMYSYYGPTPVTGTFGVAILSKYPLKDTHTYFLFSHAPGTHVKEQTAAAEATITIGPKTFTVAVTHLGNSGPSDQMQNILDALRGKNDVILMGDLNSDPGGGHAYYTAAAVLADSWLLAADGKADGREVANNDRIDHIFVSRGTRIKDSHYILGPQSDHPSMVTEIELE